VALGCRRHASDGTYVRVAGTLAVPGGPETYRSRPTGTLCVAFPVRTSTDHSPWIASMPRNSPEYLRPEFATTLHGLPTMRALRRDGAALPITVPPIALLGLLGIPRRVVGVREMDVHL